MFCSAREKYGELRRRVNFHAKQATAHIPHRTMVEGLPSGRMNNLHMPQIRQRRGQNPSGSNKFPARTRLCTLYHLKLSEAGLSCVAKTDEKRHVLAILLPSKW